jgi:hypothetical protein
MTTILTMLLREIGFEKSEGTRAGISLPWSEKGESSIAWSTVWDVALCEDSSLENRRRHFSDPRVGR